MMAPWKVALALYHDLLWKKIPQEVHEKTFLCIREGKRQVFI